MGAILQVNGITKHYNEQTTVSDVSFDIYENEVLGIIGPNGAGKTTLLECIAGILPAVFSVHRHPRNWRGETFVFGSHNRRCRYHNAWRFRQSDWLLTKGW